MTAARERQLARRAEYLAEVEREESAVPPPSRDEAPGLNRIWPYILRCGDRGFDECDYDRVAADDAAGAE